MGLDMYLRAKTKKLPYKGATGCCSGMFDLVPNDDGMVELGYWRKAYDQQDLICTIINSYNAQDDNCVNMRVMPDEVDQILIDAKSILESHSFNCEGEDAESNWPTWQSKQKWEDTIEFFTKAKDLLKEDKEAEIYYCQWY